RLDQSSLDSDVFGHFVDEDPLARLMIFDSHKHIDVALFGEQCNRIPRLGAVDRALLVLRPAVAALEITPEVDHFALEGHGFALGLGRCEPDPAEQERRGCERYNDRFTAHKRLLSPGEDGGNHGYIIGWLSQPAKSFLRIVRG